jgi:threonine 3-dehydrogenase
MFIADSQFPAYHWPESQILRPVQRSPRRENTETMSRKPVVLITGAAGEIGHALIQHLAQDGSRSIVTLDVTPLERDLASLVERENTGSILEKNLLERLLTQYEVDLVFHLAALLSTRSEIAPTTAHQVNVEGTLNLLEFAQRQVESHGRPVVFVYPSSIATYGLPDLETKNRVGRVKEDEFNTPKTMYGCNKLYCEMLGGYYARHYKQLAAETHACKVDFRCVRFPGLISALTVPSGGTSDYASEMIHAAAQGEAYACFVGPDRRIPFMAMPDGVRALIQLAAAPQQNLKRTAYNLGGFNPSAEEIRKLVLTAFPDARITYKIDPKRQGIVDSWPADVDDGAARADWGYSPRYDFELAFSEYLIPTIGARYKR